MPMGGDSGRWAHPPAPWDPPPRIQREEYQMTPPSTVPSVACPSGRPLTTLPGPRGLPLLGNLLQLKATHLPTILEHWADRYGPLYTFRLGRKPVVAVAEPTLI